MKEFDKEEKGFKIFSYVSLFITGFYFLAHILFMVSSSDLTIVSSEFEHTFFLMLLFMDIVAGLYTFPLPVLLL